MALISSTGSISAIKMDEQGSAPATPGSADWKLYFKSDGLYYIDDAATETGPLSPTGGGAAIATDTIWAAKGDLAIGTADNAAAILSVGTNGYVLTADSGETTGVKWAEAAGGSLGIWLADAAPDSAHAKDDEFSDSSLDGKWTEWDPSSTVTVAEASSGLSLTQASQGSESFGGIYQAVPASGDWAVWTKVSALGNRGNYYRMGLALFEDLAGNPSTSNLCVWEHCFGYNVRVATYTAYNDSFGSSIAAANWYIPHAYFRIRKVDTTYWFDYSADGIGWFRLTSRTAAQLGYTPAEFGLVIDNYNTSVDHKALFQFFRVQAATLSHTDVMNGNRV